MRNPETIVGLLLYAVAVIAVASRLLKHELEACDRVFMLLAVLGASWAALIRILR